MKEISANVGVSYGSGPFSVGGNYAYGNMKETKNGNADLTTNLNATGCTNDFWDVNDIFGSHEKY